VKDINWAAARGGGIFDKGGRPNGRNLRNQSLARKYLNDPDWKNSSPN
jgi:hypothetical protein